MGFGNRFALPVIPVQPLTFGRSESDFHSMANTPIHIDLSDQQEAFVREQSVARGFASPSEFVLWLIQQAKADVDQSTIDALIVEGLSSHPKHELNDDFRKSMHAEHDHRVDRRRSA